MPSDPTPPGKWFANDLRRVRESQGISRDDLVARLKFDPTILEAFEETGLVGHPRYNRVYLASFVKGLADALTLPPEAVSEALDQVYGGVYRGGIGVRFLGDPEPEPHPEHAPARPAPGPDVFPAEVAATPQPSSGVVGGIVVRRPGRWLAAVAGVATLGLTAWILVPRLLSGNDSHPEASDPVMAVEPETAPALSPRYVVGDTLRLFIVALDTLNPVRVQVDERLRAPYWIEPGDSLEFDVARHIVIQRRADRLALSIGGRRIPIVDADSEGTVRLTPARAQEILDSLRTAS